MRMLTTDVTLELWKWQGIVIVGGTSTDFTRWAKKAIAVDIESCSNAAGHAYVEMGKPWLIWAASVKDVPTLAHEALHVASGVLEARGLKHTDASEEAYTYTMEYILRAVLDRRAKWRTCGRR